MADNLSNLPIGFQALIEDYGGDADIHERLKDLGFVPGAHVEALFRAPLGGASVFRIENTTVALRDEEAQCVMISRLPRHAANL